MLGNSFLCNFTSWLLSSGTRAVHSSLSDFRHTICRHWVQKYQGNQWSARVGASLVSWLLGISSGQCFGFSEILQPWHTAWGVFHCHVFRASGLSLHKASVGRGEVCLCSAKQWCPGGRLEEVGISRAGSGSPVHPKWRVACNPNRTLSVMLAWLISLMPS